MKQMNVIVFGATGMVGQGVLRECLLDPGIERVLSVGRSATAQRHEKLREIVHTDLLDFPEYHARMVKKLSELTGLDACFFCLGVTSAGTSEEDYRRVTYSITVAAARTLARLNPQMTFLFVSGKGADSSERGRIMWARVKGEAENAVLALPFAASYVVRPAVIRPMHGIESRTASYRILYKVAGPLVGLVAAAFPGFVTTTEQLGRAMIKVARCRLNGCVLLSMCRVRG